MEINDFKYQYSIIKSRCCSSRNTHDKHRKIHDLDFEIDYLKEIWDSQQGICPLTGYSLVVKKYKDQSKQILPEHASVDRIKNDKGYVKGNIRFISVMANLALNNKFDDGQLIEFAKRIVEHNV
jgi:NRPS condensation-like uncharacterized protein